MPTLDRAVELWHRGFALQRAGDVDGAIRLYQASIAERPTARAHTWLGWAYALQRRYREAIAECKQAIACDPAFGNPYNDIGVYLMESGLDEETVAWLERATTASHSEPRHSPHLNLDRIHSRRGDLLAAARELGRACGLAPWDRELEQQLRQVQGRLD